MGWWTFQVGVVGWDILNFFSFCDKNDPKNAKISKKCYEYCRNILGKHSHLNMYFSFLDFGQKWLIFTPFFVAKTKSPKMENQGRFVCVCVCVCPYAGY